MRFNTIFHVAFLVSAVTATVVCNTNPESPSAIDLWNAISKLADVSELCVQIHQTGNMSTIMMASGEASVAITGSYLGNLNCPNAAWAAKKILNDCLVGGVASGRYLWSPEVTIVAEHL